MVEVIKIHEGALPTRLKGISKWKIPKAMKTEIRRFIEKLVLGKVNRGKRISEISQVKCLDMLWPPLEFFNVSTEQTSEADVERFEKSLSTDRIKSHLKGSPYRIAPV